MDPKTRTHMRVKVWGSKKRNEGICDKLVPPTAPHKRVFYERLLRPIEPAGAIRSRTPPGEQQNDAPSPLTRRVPGNGLARRETRKRQLPRQSSGISGAAPAIPQIPGSRFEVFCGNLGETIRARDRLRSPVEQQNDASVCYSSRSIYPSTPGLKPLETCWGC